MSSMRNAPLAATASHPCCAPVLCRRLSGQHGISGVLPQGALDIASRLSRLTVLDLSDGVLSTLPPLWANASIAQMFPNLQQLDLSGNGLTGWVSPALANLPKNLTHLALEYNSLTGQWLGQRAQGRVRRVWALKHADMCATWARSQGCHRS